MDGDLPCISCGYDLHTLPIMGRRPECGYSVGGSARKRSMRFRTFADARWTRRGVAALALGLIVSVGTELFFTLLTRYGLGLDPPGRRPDAQAVAGDDVLWPPPDPLAAP